jgi:hypothetical protein
MDITKWHVPVLQLLMFLEHIHEAEGSMTSPTGMGHFYQVKNACREAKCNSLLSKTGLQATSAKYLLHTGNMKFTTQNKE